MSWKHQPCSQLEVGARSSSKEAAVFSLHGGITFLESHPGILTHLPPKLRWVVAGTLREPGSSGQESKSPKLGLEVEVVPEESVSLSCS